MVIFTVTIVISHKNLNVPLDERDYHKSLNAKSDPGVSAEAVKGAQKSPATSKIHCSHHGRKPEQQTPGVTVRTVPVTQPFHAGVGKAGELETGEPWKDFEIPEMQVER